MDSRKFLDYVLAELKKRLAKIRVSLAQGEEEIKGMNEYYWDNYTEMDQYGFEDFDNQQALLGQVNANEEQKKLQQRFVRMLDAPFFGRVDFVYEGEDAPETFYIGIGNFAEETGGVPLIYDWRAPVSSLYYDYDKGEACYEAPGGRMDGEITGKWQYKIRGGKMLYAFESDVKIDDEMLMQELGSNGDVRLKNIVKTIQREQNRIIRNTKDRILVIQGVAGGGKTSVAMHRIAYLLYHEEQSLRSSDVLILSPNSVFSDYISRILPELGEENIREMSFDLFAYRELSDTVNDCEERCDQIERDIRQPRFAARCREKQSREFVRQLNGYVLDLEDALMEFSDLRFKGLYKTEREMEELFYFRFPDIPLLSRMQVVMDYVVDEYETLTGRDFSEEEKEILREKFMGMYRTRDLYLLYARFLEENGYPFEKEQDPEKRVLAYEDVYPVLYLKYCLLLPTGHRNVKHLVIDEMQDYSYLQYLILSQLFPCKMTILGDQAQTIGEERQDVTRFLPGILGRDIRMIRMNKSYRNTVEIAGYANRLAGITDMEVFERHGKPVTECCYECPEEAFDAVLGNLWLWMAHSGEEDEDGEANEAHAGKERFETAALLVMTQAQADYAAAYLERRLKEGGRGAEKILTCIDRDSTKFQKGLTVTTFYFAKGLEFDQVFTVYEGAKKQDPFCRQARYICATRALHELYMSEVRSW